jgi:hypothetical protein
MLFYGSHDQTPRRPFLELMEDFARTKFPRSRDTAPGTMFQYGENSAMPLGFNTERSKFGDSTRCTSRSTLATLSAFVRKRKWTRHVIQGVVRVNTKLRCQSASRTKISHTHPATPGSCLSLKRHDSRSSKRYAPTDCAWPRCPISVVATRCRQVLFEL